MIALRSPSTGTLPGGTGRRANHRANALLLSGTALFTIWLGFEAGGFFPDATGIAAVAAAVALIVRVAVVEHPLGGLRWRSVVATGSLVLFAVWTLVSSAWSHADGRAVLEFNLVLLYVLVLVLFSCVPYRAGRLVSLAGGFGLGSVVLCGAGLATRALPAVFPIRSETANDRLAFPLTYWNTLGLLAVLGTLVCLGLSATERLPRVLRILPTGGIPVLAATLLLTFSRGALAAGVVGLALLVATCRSRALFLTLLASAPPAALAVNAAYSATALATVNPTGPRAVSQGHHVIAIVSLCCLGTLVARTLLAPLDRRGDRPPRLGRRARRLVTGVVLVVVAGGGGAAATALDLPSRVAQQYHRFVIGDQIPTGHPERERLLNPANHGRLAEWRVALAAWKAQPLHGQGAGTYVNLWNRHRDLEAEVLNAHSLYLEVLAELGIVGIALLAICLVAVVAGLATRIRGPDRAVAACLFAAAVAYLLQAAVDWDWQMPVISWWLFAAGGMALSRSADKPPGLAMPGRLSRLLVMAGIGLVALLPIQVALSQRSLTRSVAAFARGNCNEAVRYALESISDLAARAEPYEMIGYCDARYGRRDLAIAAIQNAIERDPQDWEFHYDLALVRGVSGLDPRREAATARALNPLSTLAVSLDQALHTTNARVWRARAAAAPLLVPSPP